MSPKPEQIIFVDIRMEDNTNYLFNNAEAAQAVYIQLNKFESYCKKIGIKPYFHTPSKDTDATFIQKVTLDSRNIVEIDFMKIEYARFSYVPEKEW